MQHCARYSQEEDADQVVHLASLFAADADTRVKVLLHIKSYRDRYFTGTHLVNRVSQMIRAEAWKCLACVLSTCAITHKMMRCMFAVLCTHIEKKLGGDLFLVNLVDQQLPAIGLHTSELATPIDFCPLHL
jgi:hypothetical protein